VNVDRRWKNWIGQAGYMFADARLATGAMIPEVPKHQGTAQLTFTGKSTLISGGIRAFSLVFDDDLNQFKLPGFTVLGISAEQRITKRLSALASVDNLLDRAYLVALTPNPNTGAPRLWRFGLRWRGSLR
jgi:outer membrane receptor protein involved in Fe transport